MSFITLTPYKFYCAKVLPLVYDDSLSYYEQLCKLVQKLNDTITQVNINTEDIAHLKELVANIELILNDYNNFKEQTNNNFTEMNKKISDILVAYENLINRVVALENELLGVTSLVNDINGEVV